MRNRKSLLVLVAVTATILLAAVYFTASNGQPAAGPTVKSQGFSGPPAQASATPIHHYGAESGALNAALISPDDVTLQIVDVQKSATKWIFHFQAHNNASQAVPILDAGTNHYFMLSLRGTPGTPYAASQLFIKLTAPVQADLAAHPALPTTVVSSADADGWLVADLTNIAYPPFQLLYVYGTVTGTECADPKDQTTCHPVEGYRTLVWQL